MISNFDEQNRLFDEGYNLETGNKISQNFESAIQKYEEAGRLGHAGAYCRAGICCQFRLNPPDINKAVQYYELSIEQFEQNPEHNDASAYVYLSGCYNLGSGVWQDDKQADELMKKAEIHESALIEYNKMKKENKIG